VRNERSQKQVALLSQRGRSMLRVIDYFVIRNDTVEWGMCKSLLEFYWNYVPRTVSEIFSVKECRDLETRGVAVVQGHWKWRRSIDHIRLCIGPPKIYGYGSAILNIALSCTVFELFDVELYRDLEIWVRCHSR